MSEQITNESLPANLKLYGSVYLAISLIAAAIVVFFSVFAREGYFPILLGIGLAAIFQGLGVKLLFSFFAEAVICLHAIAGVQPLQKPESIPDGSLDEALGIM